MCKHKLSCVLLFNLFFIPGVPYFCSAAFDAPDPEPISFSLANLISFPNVITYDSHQQKGWYLATGAARLFEMPEIQPFSIRIGGPVIGGRWKMFGSGLNVGVYNEMLFGTGYERRFSPSIAAELEACLLQVSIKGYGNAWSYQFNTRVRWRVQSSVELALTWINVNGARLGTSRYPLPRRIAIGGRLEPARRVHLFLELEQDTRYSTTSRFGIGWQVLDSITNLFGFQSDPDILSAGVSFLVKSTRATAAFQYHPDLGISQCYGLAITF